MTPSEFIIQFPELGNVPIDYIQSLINRSALYVDASTWGAFANEGTAYWVAHQIATSQQNAAQMSGDPEEYGAIMKKAGDTAIQFSEKVAVARLTGDSYLGSNYGQYFLQLKRIVGTGIIAV